MDLPIVHPTAIRFYLEKIGINPRDERSVVLGYGCLRLLEHVVKSRDWRFPHAAYQNERNHRVLSELFSEIVPEIDSLFESPDFWAIFNNTYEHAIKLSFPDFIRNVCPNFVADPDECVRLLEGDAFGTGAVSPDIARSLHTVVIFLCRDTDTFEQAYMDYLRFFTLAGIDPLQRSLFFELFTVVNGYSLSSGPKIRTSSNAAHAISFFSSLSLPINFQIDLYASIQEHITKGIDNPFAYLSKRATEYNSYLFESMARFEAEFNKYSELLRTVKPSEFLETLIAEETLWKKYGALTTADVVYVTSDKERLPAKKLKKRRGAVPDAVTECAFVYSRFKNYLSATQGMQKVLIVNPSIPFIRQWVTSKALAGIETHFMMHWESSATILSQEFSRFPHCRFFAPKDFSGSTLEGYDSYLLFHRDYIDNASQMEFVVSLISVIGADRVFCLFPDEQTKELVKQLSAREYFRCNPYLDAVDILPTKVFTSESQRGKFFFGLCSLKRIPVCRRQFI